MAITRRVVRHIIGDAPNHLVDDIRQTGITHTELRNAFCLYANALEKAEAPLASDPFRAVLVLLERSAWLEESPHKLAGCMD